MYLRRLKQGHKLFFIGAGLTVILFLLLTGRLFKKEQLSLNEQPMANEELLILGTSETIDGLNEQEVYTDQGVYLFDEEMDWTSYIFQSVQAVVEENKIIHISNLLQREVKLENCLITENSTDGVKIFSEGYMITIPCKNLNAEFSDEIVDLFMANGCITKISTKKESISGKILSVRAEGIEIQGYGVVPVAENFRCYETYGEYREKESHGLIVGYEQAKLIAAEGKICAAIMDMPISPEKIRVLLKTTDYTDMVHSKIHLKAQGEYEVLYGNTKRELRTGEELVLTSDSEYLKNGRVILRSKNQQSQISVLNIKRSCGTPSYAGNLEISKDSAGMVMVNEVDLETYLYGVVPSEMPSGYELEALKAQAVCARSYAYGQILLNGYAAYGAHVDDSVSYQVYNNLPTDDKVKQAVNETAGKVLTFEDEVVSAYYFSTSCGYTTNETIWKNGSLDHSYISGKLLNDSQKKLDLRSEEAFREFILNESYETYDSGESWYRWDVTIPAEQLTENVCQKKNIGKVSDIEVTERNEGGVAQKVAVKGEKGELELEFEYEIRSVLNGKGETVRRTYGEDTVGGSLLPSGFFVVDKVEEDGALTAFRFRGGGFGHGAGMSQNGANHMAESGKKYEEILEIFYHGAVLSHI